MDTPIISRRRVVIGSGTFLAASAAETALGKAANLSTQITRAGSQASTNGSADYFTGTVRIDPVFPVREPSRVSAGSVTFEPGARTAWHTHPLGQTLIITYSASGRSACKCCEGSIDFAAVRGWPQDLAGRGRRGSRMGAQ
jgi:uncharacterized RmlC-like cupin family protein